MEGRARPGARLVAGPRPNLRRHDTSGPRQRRRREALLERGASRIEAYSATSGPTYGLDLEGVLGLVRQSPGTPDPGAFASALPS